jgi:hypothetical protein
MHKKEVVLAKERWHAATEAKNILDGMTNIEIFEKFGAAT